MAEIKWELNFSCEPARLFFECDKRNQLALTGYGAGKTYVGCQKLITLMINFPGYRTAVARYNATELKRTTVQTFFKVCPKEFYDSNYGGKVIEGNPSYVTFINGSRLYWLHSDEFNESTWRSLEINSVMIDQAEEVPEQVYLTADSRVGRWDAVDVPEWLLQSRPNWPRNRLTNRPLAPAYMLLLANPPDEGEFSYLFTRYSPESEDYNLYKETHAFFQWSSRENLALPIENLQTMLTRDSEWVDRFVEGKFTRGGGAIHSIDKSSILTVDEDWVNRNIINRGSLARVLDHGASSPTCCGWYAALKDWHFAFREYYQPDKVVSYHRKRIAELSGDEHYNRNLADPAIFKKTLEKFGGFWTVADEYRDTKIDKDAVPIFWTPADNNEFATRNRIDELLRIDPDIRHPVTGEFGAPRLYFVKRTADYPFGCQHIIKETSSQKKKLLAEINGKKVYSDEREDSIADHGYDTLRYYCGSHLSTPAMAKPHPKPNSFIAAQKRIKALIKMGKI